MKIKRILVGIDSLSGRDAAFERALALAKASGAELYLLYAAPPDRPFSFGAEERVRRMAELRRRAAEADVQLETVEQHGDAADIIELHANTRGIDLIVIGAEPRRGWRQRSPVAERIVRRTDVPTLVVTSDGSQRGRAFRKVLAAVDLTPASKDVLQGALAIAAGEPVELTVMHSIPDVEADDAVRSPSRWLVPEYRSRRLEEARQGATALAAGVPEDVDTRVVVSTGSAARAILEHVDDADLLVVGRSQGFRMLGSTALRVLRGNVPALLVTPAMTRSQPQLRQAA